MFPPDKEDFDIGAIDTTIAVKIANAERELGGEV